MVDRIADIWGTRTQFGQRERWPVRVDQVLAEGLTAQDVGRWRTRAGEAGRPGRPGTYLPVVAGIAALLAVSGCAPDGTAPADAAEQFLQAVSSSDWSSACSMLESATREKTAREQKSSCEDHLRNLQFQEPGTVTRTEIYGRGAFVEFENDAVFLAAAEGGWKITAAGCTPNGDAPYTCEVGGN